MTPTLAKFYRFFWSDPVCRKIFLKHKEQLLEKQVIDLGKKHTFYFQRIVLSNSHKHKRAYPHLIQRIENRQIDFEQDLEQSVNKNIDIEVLQKYFEEQLEKILSKISSRLNGSNISQIRLLSEFVHSVLSEKRLLGFLKKYEIVPDKLQSLSEIGDIVNAVFEKEVAKNLRSEHMIDALRSLDSISAMYNNQIFEGLMGAHKFFTDVLYEDEDFSNRVALFDHLYEAGAIEGGVFPTYYECTACDIGVFSGNMIQRIKPSKIKMRCPNCNKEVFFLSPYGIEAGLYEHILDKDGLLFFAIQYLLDKHNIEFKINLKFEPDVELDIALVQDQGISDVIEVKMYKSNTPFQTQLGNLRTAASKLLQARDKLIKNPNTRGFENIHYHIVTNLPDSNLVSTLTEEMRDELQKARMTVYSPDDFLRKINRHQ